MSVRQKINLLGVAAATAFITYESTVRLTEPVGQEIGLSMLMLHGVAYFGLASALLIYLHDTSNGHLEAILIASTVGLSLELIQMHLPYRFFGWKDLVANTAGASLVLLDYRLFVASRVVQVEDRILNMTAEVSKYF